MTLEELYYLPDGSSFYNGPGSYKIPQASNIPIEFNVSIAKARAYSPKLSPRT